MNESKIGRYEVKSEVGRGGMATVFLAYDPRFERSVAIKVLPQALLHDPQFRTRFEREAKMIALLEHPAIVPVYDIGEEAGQPYIVMRYMSGGSLADRLQAGPLSVAEAVQIVNRIAPALDAAHAKGIIHRDLKPGNILFDQYGNAFLSDFGIARLAEQPGVTLTGDTIVGTPAYMSPEQVQGDKELDGRSDIYALGIILYQMLAGKAPYRSDTPAKTMLMHVLEPVPKVLVEKPDLPPGCEKVIARALAKAAEERFASTGEMASALEAAIHTGETSFHRPSTAETIVSKPPERPLPASPETVVSASPPGALPAVPVAPRRTSSVRLLSIILAVIFLAGMALSASAGLAYLGNRGSGPLSMFFAPTATSTLQPTDTLPPPAASTVSSGVTASATAVASGGTAVAVITKEAAVTPTRLEAPAETPVELPSATPEPLPAAPIIGGADKIAFFNASEVWIANLDGSELTQLTKDGAQKKDLQWSPDGEAVIYLTGNCVYAHELATGKINDLVCFQPPNTLNTFSLSQNGQHVAVGLNRELFILPFDREKLHVAKKKSDLEAMAACPSLAPYNIEGKVIAVEAAYWGANGDRLAIIRKAPLEGKQIDLVHLLDISQCSPFIPRLDEFPGVRFKMDGYNVQPELQNIAWDGEALFSLFSVKRNGGFGDLWIYNTELYRGEQIKPVDNACCYRDPQFSPDGRFLLFAFQDMRLAPASVIKLYYVPFGTVGTGMNYAPLPLPEDFFTDPRSRPQPVLRPAR